MLLLSESYQAFLEAEFSRRTQTNARYSQRAFAKDLKLSPGELSEVLKKKRKLSLKSAFKIVRALGLNQAEAKHLIYLVELEKSKEIGSEDILRNAKQVFTTFEGNEQMTLDMFQLVSDWYCFAILNLSECEGFRWNENWISKRLGISVSEIRLAVKRLIRVGLVSKLNGKYKVTKDVVISPEGIPSEAIRNYHRQMLKKAAVALDTQPVEEREIVGVGLALHPKHIPTIKKKVSKFLDEIASQYQRSRNKQEVYQVEVALFKLSQGESCEN